MNSSLPVVVMQWAVNLVYHSCLWIPSLLVGESRGEPELLKMILSECGVGEAGKGCLTEMQDQSRSQRGRRDSMLKKDFYFFQEHPVEKLTKTETTCLSLGSCIGTQHLPGNSLLVHTWHEGKGIHHRLIKFNNFLDQFQIPCISAQQDNYLYSYDREGGGKTLGQMKCSSPCPQSYCVPSCLFWVYLWHSVTLSIQSSPWMLSLISELVSPPIPPPNTHTHTHLQHH